MGRLTLNVLLSFAQFEREVAGERIRDKVAASKKKGIWVGGVVPLGYRLENRKLVIDDTEAATVRRIFQRYLEVEGMTPLLTELRRGGVATRRRVLATGKAIGGIPFGRGALGYLLKNRMYIGELNHRGLSYPGEHPPIINRDLFEAVQTKLADNRAVERRRQTASEALLIGRIFDDRGNRMTPTHSCKNGARYRYYTSRALSDGRKDEAGSVIRIPAPDVEALVLAAVRSLESDVAGTPCSSGILQDSGSPLLAALAGQTINSGAALCDQLALIAATVNRVIIRTGSVDVHLSKRDVAGRAAEPISIPWVKPSNHRRRKVLEPSNGDVDQRTIGADARAALVDVIVRAREWLDEIVSGKVASVDAIAEHEGRTGRSIRMTLSLAFLAPDIVRAIVEGALPRGLGLTGLADLPPAWAEQLVRLGLDRRPQTGL